MTCHCCSGECKKSGFYQNRNRGVQRFKCLKCGKGFSESQPLTGTRVEIGKAAQVISMLFEGIGINAIRRLTSLNKQTVLNVLESAGQHCAGLLDAKVLNVKVEQVEVDELFSYVARRAHFVEADDPARGAFYCFLSIDRDSKLIINHHLGKRTSEDSVTFIEDLKRRTTNDKFQLSSDGFTGYGGYKGAVFQTFGESIDFGMEIKTFGPLISRTSTAARVPTKFNPVVCKSVRRIAMIGNPEHDKINTNRVERLNLTMRLFNRRFTRCTLGYSKKIENHRHAIALFIAMYNFVRRHSAHGQTPAQKAGLTDHTWTVEEMISTTI